MDKIITIFYQNCRGLRTKLHTAYMNVLLFDYDIIILTETWLHGEISDREFIDERYQVYRSDRDLAASGRGIGGGVLIAVRHALAACPGGVIVRLLGCGMPAGCGSRPPPLTAPDAIIDHVTLELSIGTQKYIVGAVYIPTNINANSYLSYFDYMLELLQNVSDCNVCVVGDFNLPDIEWISKGKRMEPNILCNNRPTQYFLILF